jgi:hypothetical protein
MVYSDTPPYDVLRTEKVSFKDIQRMKRFARFWDITYNSGNFNRSVRLLWPDGSVFEHFLAFSDWVYLQTASTYKIALERMAQLLFTYLTDVLHVDEQTAGRALAEDLSMLKGRKIPAYLRPYLPEEKTERTHQAAAHSKRQAKHLDT